MATLRDIMSPAVITLGSSMTLAEAAAQLARHHISGAPVLYAGRVIGVVSIRDIAAARAASPPDDVPTASNGNEQQVIRVRDVMTQHVLSLPPTATVQDADDLMRKARIHRVLVMENEQMYGVVSAVDVARALTNAAPRAPVAARSESVARA